MNFSEVIGGSEMDREGAVGGRPAGSRDEEAFPIETISENISLSSELPAGICSGP